MTNTLYFEIFAKTLVITSRPPMGIFVRLFWTFTVFIHSGHSFEFDSGNVNDAVDTLEQELQQALSAAEFPFQAEAVSDCCCC